MRNIAIGLALLSLVCCSGCGTIIAHCSHDDPSLPQSGTYRGVRADIVAVKDMAPLAGGGPTFILALCPVIDLPLSALADTAASPYDLWHSKKESATQGASDLKKDNAGTPKSE